MTGLLLFALLGVIFAALGFATMRWGVDTRDWSLSIH
jgi:hypothetical protein